MPEKPAKECATISASDPTELCSISHRNTRRSPVDQLLILIYSLPQKMFDSHTAQQGRPEGVPFIEVSSKGHSAKSCDQALVSQSGLLLRSNSAIFKTPAGQQCPTRPYSAWRVQAALPTAHATCVCAFDQASESNSKSQVSRKGALSHELSYTRFGRLSRTSFSPKSYVSRQNSHDTCGMPQEGVAACQQQVPRTAGNRCWHH